MDRNIIKYINVNGQLMDLSHPQVMGILNVTYCSPSEGAVSFGWDTPFRTKDKNMPLRWKYRYDNPYCKTLFDSSIIQIEREGKKLMLDLEKGKRTVIP